MSTTQALSTSDAESAANTEDAKAKESTEIEEAAPVFDFRSILDYPPVNSNNVEILDPSWDAHKVLFSEFNDSKKSSCKIEAVDMFDADEFPESNSTFHTSLNDTKGEETGAETAKFDFLDEVDPLGWPKSTREFMPAPTTDPFESSAAAVPEDLKDDEMLLNKEEADIPTASDNALTKEERIEKYTTIEPDETSEQSINSNCSSSDEEPIEDTPVYEEQPNIGGDEDETHLTAIDDEVVPVDTQVEDSAPSSENAENEGGAIKSDQFDNTRPDAGSFDFDPDFGSSAEMFELSEGQDKTDPAPSQLHATNVGDTNIPLRGLDDLGAIHISLPVHTDDVREPTKFITQKEVDRSEKKIPLLAPPPEEKLKNWLKTKNITNSSTEPQPT